MRLANDDCFGSRCSSALVLHARVAMTTDLGEYEVLESLALAIGDPAPRPDHPPDHFLLKHDFQMVNTQERVPGFLYPPFRMRLVETADGKHLVVINNTLPHGHWSLTNQGVLIVTFNFQACEPQAKVHIFRAAVADSAGMQVYIQTHCEANRKNVLVPRSRQ